MIYPNGSYSLNNLKDFVLGNDIDVYFEEYKEEPEGWDWKKQGFFHGDLTKVNTVEELVTYIKKEVQGEGTICYDFKPEYFSRHPHSGESIIRNCPQFFWEYTSINGKRYSYKIEESKYLTGYEPEYPSMSLNCYTGAAAFSGSCIAIGTWERDKEGYEFKSVGSRIFEYIDNLDIRTIWSAIKEADDFLRTRYLQEENN